MSRLSLTVFDGACELLLYEEAANGKLKIEVDEDIRGRVFIDTAVFNMIGGECEVDLSQIPDGTHTPLLYRDKDMLPLPKIQKIGNAIKPILNEEGEILAAAKRAREAICEVRVLLAEVKRLQERIEGSFLAIGEE